MLLSQLLFLHQIFTFVQGISFLPTGRSIKLDRFDGMGRGKDVPIRTSFKIMSIDPTVMYFNSTSHVSENLTWAEPLMYYRLIRCRSRENLDTCEDFISPRPSSYCSVLDPTKFNPMRVDYTPPFKCPILKGTYSVYNYKLDVTTFAVFPLGDWYWKNILSVKDAKTQRLLYVFEAEVHLVKKH